MKIFKKNIQKNKGFSLIELMVASSVFIVVMLMSAGAIFTVFNANQKSKNLRSVMDNLNLSLESMTRTIRFGNSYYCGATPPSTPSQLDCPGVGGGKLSIFDSSGVQTIFDLNNGRIRRVRAGETSYLTSTDVTISNLKFRVYGSALYGGGTNLQQPKVIIVVAGVVGTKVTTQSSFTIQTAVSQREFDFQ